MSFQLFDPQGELRITVGNLPHWFQPGVTYFVTFRTADSIPRETAKLWYRRRDDWLRRHGINPAEPAWQQSIHGLPDVQQREFHGAFSLEYQAHLDRGHGECALRRPELGRIVADTLLHFDRERYHISDFVVMPNHVHVLVGLLGSTDIEKQCYSWKKFTAAHINQMLDRRGRFWQEASFDHLVRGAEEFDYLQRYIADNPVKANLRAGEYLYYRSLQQSR